MAREPASGLEVVLATVFVVVASFSAGATCQARVSVEKARLANACAQETGRPAECFRAAFGEGWDDTK